MATTTHFLSVPKDIMCINEYVVPCRRKSNDSPRTWR